MHSGAKSPQEAELETLVARLEALKTRLERVGEHLFNLAVSF
jgi:hypothetical protein